MFIFELPENVEGLFQKRRWGVGAAHHAFQSLCGRHDVEWRGQSLRNTKPLIYGGIVCTRVGSDIYYALVQGRQTGKWSFPKGHANEGEEPLKCALREIEEETGLTGLVEDNRVCGKVGYGYYFLFVLPEKVELKAVDTKEIMETAWVTVEEMHEMNVNADVMSFLRVGTFSPVGTFCPHTPHTV